VVTVIRSEVPGIKMGMRVAVIDRGETLGDEFDASLRAGMLADARAAIATGESCNRTYRSDLGNVDVFVEAILPPPRLFVFGSGHDAVPVVQLAKTLGWDVCVCPADQRVSVRQRFTIADEVLVGTLEELATRIDQCDRAMAVIMSHHYETDRSYLGMLVGTHCRYIGVLGPRTRTTRMLAELGLGLSGDVRIHAPVGAELGAETPQELALGIVAEVQARLAHAPGKSVRDRVVPELPRIAQAVADAVAIDTTPALEAVPNVVAVETALPATVAS
jgi:xanthine/CO dehydrogenase XdhC/CoxF family maturation factor